MKKYYILALCFAFFPAFSHASDVTVSTAPAFQQALDDAEVSPDAENIIRLAAGNYSVSENGGTAFTYDASSQTAPLSIVGAGASLSILDGANTAAILDVVAGGAISLSGVTLQNGNSLHDGGGAKLSSASGDLSVSNNIFQNNTSAINGGGLVLTSLATSAITLTVSGNHFILNTAIVDGGGSFITPPQDNFSLILSDNLFENNQANESGGLLIEDSTTGDLTLSNNSFLNNISDDGTSALTLAFGVGTLVFDANEVLDNVGSQSVVRILPTGGTALITNNIVANNESNSGAAGLYCGSYEATVNIINNTVFNNISVTGPGGIFVGNAGVDGGSPGAINIYNNIIYENVGAVTQGEGGQAANNDITVYDLNAGSMNVYNNDFSTLCVGGGGNFECNPAEGTVSGLTLSANINANPLFTSSSDFNLLSGSPAIDTGTLNAPNMPSLDYAGNPRPSLLESNPDMGALEYESSTISSQSLGGGARCSMQNPDQVPHPLPWFLIFSGLGLGFSYLYFQSLFRKS